MPSSGKPDGKPKKSGVAEPSYLETEVAALEAITEAEPKLSSSFGELSTPKAEQEKEPEP